MDQRLIELYAAGVSHAEFLYGAETRDFDRVLSGVAAMFKGGEPTTDDIIAVAGRWHNPLAGIRADTPPDQVASAMEHILKWNVEDSRQSYETTGALDASRRFWAIDHARERAAGMGVEREADILIDSEIKRKFPKVRRGTKRYAELRESVLDKARAMVVEEAKRRHDEQIAFLRREMGELRQVIEHAVSRATWLEAMARDIEAILPGSPVAAEAAGRAAEIREKAAAVTSPFEAAIAEMETERGGL